MRHQELDCIIQPSMKVEALAYVISLWKIHDQSESTMLLWHTVEATTDDIFFTTQNPAPPCDLPTLYREPAIGQTVLPTYFDMKAVILCQVDQDADLREQSLARSKNAQVIWHLGTDVDRLFEVAGLFAW